MADNISTGILSGLYEKVYNPDVLSCLANLSNDEVFTPPEIVNKMLDTAIRKDEYKKLFYNQQESMNAPQPTEATEDIVELKKEVTRSSAVKSVQPSGKSTAASPATPPLVTEKFGIKSPVPKAALPVPDRKHTNTPDFDESSITVGMTVIHKKFGEGKVQSIADKHIYVKFADGQKNFAFPNAFTDGFLHLPK